MIGLLALAMAATAGSKDQPSSQADRCRERLAMWSGERRSLRADDLVELMDFGSDPDLSVDPMFAVSPDGQTVAVAVRRADIARNDFCSGLYIVPANGPPRLADGGPGLLRWAYPNLLGKADYQTGVAAPIAPRWSPDGKEVAYLSPSYSLSGRSGLAIVA